MKLKRSYCNSSRKCWIYLDILALELETMKIYLQSRCYSDFKIFLPRHNIKHTQNIKRRWWRQKFKRNREFCLFVQLFLVLNASDYVQMIFKKWYERNVETNNSSTRTSIQWYVRWQWCYEDIKYQLSKMTKKQTKS